MAAAPTHRPYSINGGEGHPTSKGARWPKRAEVMFALLQRQMHEQGHTGRLTQADYFTKQSPQGHRGGRDGFSIVLTKTDGEAVAHLVYTNTITKQEAERH